MTEARDLKRLVRARMAATDEPYVLARRRVLGGGDLLVPTQLARTLEAARRDKGWTRQEAACRLEVSKLKVALVEKGEGRVDEPLVAALAGTYALEPAVLRRLWRLAEARREADLARAPRSGTLSGWSGEPTVWMATRGRRSGRWRTKWWITFVVDGDVVYFFEIDPDRADWVRNIRAHPQVWLWTATSPPRPASAVEVTAEPERRRARQLLEAKHSDHRDLVEWALVVAATVTGVR